MASRPAALPDSKLWIGNFARLCIFGGLRKLLIICGIVSSLLLASAESAPGAATISELSREAELVVRAVVQSATVQRDKSGRIFTEVELKVAEAWRGNPPKGLLHVVHPGGVLGETATLVSHQPQYDPEEEVILFLTRNPSGKYITVGMGRGKWTVEGGKAASKEFSFEPISLETIKQLVQAKE